jgi:copper chaperone CopZ
MKNIHEKQIEPGPYNLTQAICRKCWRPLKIIRAMMKRPKTITVTTKGIDQRGTRFAGERERLNMTLMDVTFPYRVPPGTLQMTALGCVREVYGVRKISFDEAKQTVKVEYDISRLAEEDIAGLLRGAGLDISVPIRLVQES